MVANAEPLLDVRDIAVRFGGIIALDGVSFTIDKGQILGLIVEGDITNKTAAPHNVPHLRVALRDGSQKELIFKTVDPPRERLLPGETSHFVVGFLPAPDAAAGVLVTFVPG